MSAIENSTGANDTNNGDNTNKGNDKSKGNGAAPGGFDPVEYDADMLRVSGLPREEQDIELEKLVKKYGAYGIKRPTIKAQLKEANEERARQVKASREKERREREENARRTKCSNATPPPDYLKSVLADTDSTMAELVFALNTEYAYVLEAGKATVMRQVFEPTLKRNVWVRMTPADFRSAYENRRVHVGFDTRTGNPVFDELGKRWLKNADRRQYLGGVVFLPAGKVGEDYLNLWVGFLVEPKKGDWKKMLRHIYRIICNRNKKAFKYLMCWMASVLQHPELQGYAAVIMRGELGAGKGILAQVFLRILGPHALHILSSRHLVGNFNLQLQCCVFAFLDEAFFAGDKQHESVLKGLITEPTLTVEGKYMNPAEQRNYLHIMAASNSDWVVPANIKERRFLVLDVLDEHANDHTYFAPILRQMKEEGGDAAMMYDLLRVDLSGFNPADIPETEGLRNQKQLSLRLEFKWFEDVLSRGHVMDAMPGYHDDEVCRWFEDATTKALFASYELFVNKQRIPYARRLPLEGATGFGNFMRSKLGFAVTQSVDALDGMVKGEGLDFNKIKAKMNPDRHHGYHLGSLEAREKFAKATLEMASAPESTPVPERTTPWPDDGQRKKTEWTTPLGVLHVVTGGRYRAAYDDADDYNGKWVNGRWFPS